MNWPILLPQPPLWTHTVVWQPPAAPPAETPLTPQAPLATAAVDWTPVVPPPDPPLTPQAPIATESIEWTPPDPEPNPLAYKLAVRTQTEIDALFQIMPPPQSVS